MTTTHLSRNLLVYIGGTALSILAVWSYAVRWHYGNRIIAFDTRADGSLSLTAVNSQLSAVEFWLVVFLVNLFFAVVNRHVGRSVNVIVRTAAFLLGGCIMATVCLGTVWVLMWVLMAAHSACISQ